MKAILVIDLEEDMIGEVDYTILTKENMCNGRAQLKPMPQKKECYKLVELVTESDFMTGFKCGWNDCVDEILGGNK